MAPTFLTFAQVLAIHQDQIARYGGESGLRDMTLLKSAVGSPAATFDGRFLYVDVFEMAAAYLFNIVKDHPFVDGNKRTGLLAAYVFLKLNGYRLDVKQLDLAETTLAVASGKLGKAELAVYLREYSHKFLSQQG